MTRRLADVAKKVGVSEATVSRVLNGKPGVSQTTRDAVLTALDVLGYERPTQLRGERARLVGLVLPELQNPIFPALAEVVGGGLAQQGFTPVLCVRGAGGLSEASYVRMLLDQHVSGMVFAGGNFAEADSPHDHYELLLERGVPAVLVNAAAEHLGYPRVCVDDAAAVEQALGHLLSLGHRRVGLIIGPDDHMPSRRKLAAFTALTAQAGIDTAGAVEHTILGGGRARLGRPPGAGGHHRHRVRQRPAGAGGHPGRAPAGHVGTRRRLGGGLRRLGADDLHGPAADHGAAAYRRDGPGRGEHPGPAGRGRHDRIVRAALRARAGRPGLHGPGPGLTSQRRHHARDPHGYAAKSLIVP
jgi:hypothetical protein